MRTRKERRIQRRRQSTRRALALSMAMLMVATSFGTAFLALPEEAEAAFTNFPASYRPALIDLQRRFPNWNFVPLNTNLDWNHVLDQQRVMDRSLIQSTAEPAMRDSSRPRQVEPGWVNASRAGIAFYLDPRNFLDERNIFQFESHSFNSRDHTHAGVTTMLNGTFMAGSGNIRFRNTSGNMATLNQSYATVIFNAGRDNMTSPYFLTARIIQEVGTQGSNSVTGNVPGFTGIYNFYNIGAHAGSNPVNNGLRWASTGTSYGRPWTDPRRSIRGGAQWISERYIRRGQDSFYLQKWSVSPNSPRDLLFWHQFMTNISAAASEGQRLHATYSNLGMLGHRRTFHIPVYRNMPQFPAYRPGNGFPDSNGSLFFVNATRVNVRSGPGTNFSSIASVPQGATFRVLNLRHTTANGHTWAHVEFANGQRGFIANGFLTPRRHAATPTRFTVSYNANGGRGTMANTTVTFGNATPLRRNTFTHPQGHNFVGWHARRTDAQGRFEWRYINGAGQTRWIRQGATIPAGFARSLYRDQHSVSATTSLNNGQVTMFAQWAPSRFTVSYNANGGRGTMANTTVHFNINTPLRHNTFTPPTGQRFAGWHMRRTLANGTHQWRYTNGSTNQWISEGTRAPAGFVRRLHTNTTVISSTTSINNGRVTMFAQWAPSRFTVSYDANGGRGTMANTTVHFGINTPLRHNTFTRSGHVFAGWYARRTMANGTFQWRHNDGWRTGRASLPSNTRSLYVYSDRQALARTTGRNNGQVTMFAAWAPAQGGIQRTQGELLGIQDEILNDEQVNCVTDEPSRMVELGDD